MPKKKDPHIPKATKLIVAVMRKYRLDARSPSLSQRSLAIALGRDPSYISRLEGGEYYSVPMDLFLDFCNIVGKHPCELLAETGVVTLTTEKHGDRSTSSQA